MTRAHGLHTHLLAASDYQAMLKSEDVQSVSEYLTRGDYSARLGEPSSLEGPTAARLAKAAYSLLVSRCRHIAGVAPGRGRDFLEAYLERFTVEDVRRILRAKRAGEDARRAVLISDPKGGLVDLQTMSEAPTLQDAIDSLKRTRFRAVSHSLAAYLKYGLLSIVEASIDRVYFDSEVRPALHGLPGLQSIEEMLGTEVDLVNIRTLADLRARGVAPDAVRAVALAPMRLTAADVELLSQASPDSIPEIISRTRYGGLTQQVRDALDAGRYESLDHIVRLEILRRTRALMVASADSLAYVLGYVREAEAEANNIVSIATGKELGMPDAQIEAALCL